jgi:hypothetical protein
MSRQNAAIEGVEGSRGPLPNSYLVLVVGRRMDGGLVGVVSATRSPTKAD